MKNRIRLYLFEALHGNRVAINELIKLYGIKKALLIAIKLKTRLRTRNPFSEMNKHNKPSSNEKASQQQMAPVIVLYDLLTEMGFSNDDAIADIQSLIIVVATKFLQFNVPILTEADYQSRNNEQRVKGFTNITNRFFNAEGDLSQNGQNEMRFTVNRCHFASYSKALGYPQLAPVFCIADKHFFDKYQPKIEFGRTVTLAQQQTPCDFSFKVKIESL